MRFDSRKPLVIFVLAVFVLSLSHCTPNGATSTLGQGVLEQGKASAKAETALGLHTAMLETPQGKIKVNLPDDMAPGDTISGTVSAEPAGRTEQERRKNTDELNGYVLEVAQEQTPVARGILKWIIPATLTGGVAALIFKDTRGKEIGRTTVPVHPPPPSTRRLASPSPADYALPLFGRAGRPARIHGPFDGDFSTTSVKIGGQDVRVLAESPRKVVFESPGNIVGATEIELKKDGVLTKDKFVSLRVTLTSPKTALVRGETTTVTTRIDGLQGLPAHAYPIPLELVNRSPETISFEGVQEQQSVHFISFASVSAEGTYAFTTSVRGIRAGTFQIGVLLSLAGDQTCGNTAKCAPAACQGQETFSKGGCSGNDVCYTQTTCRDEVGKYQCYCGR